MARVYKIYGPPGTGKTFRLIRRAQAYRRRGIPYHKIGYFAFTRKAAGEARSRIGVSEKDVPYFQTLHAFGFHLLGLKEENIFILDSLIEYKNISGQKMANKLSENFKNKKRHRTTLNRQINKLLDIVSNSPT